MPMILQADVNGDNTDYHFFLIDSYNGRGGFES